MEKWTKFALAVRNEDVGAVKTQLRSLGPFGANACHDELALPDRPAPTALQFAVLAKNTKLCKVLLDSADIDANASDDLGNTALMLACRHHTDAAIATLLVSAKKAAAADVNAANEFGWTALMCAVEGGNDKLSETLLAHPQLDPGRCNAEGDSADVLALRKGFATMAQKIEAEIAHRKAGRTPSPNRQATPEYKQLLKL